MSKHLLFGGRLSVLNNIIFNVLVVLIICNSFSTLTASSIDYTRLQQVMAKARRGEPIVISAIGGSITQGAGASSKAYADGMSDWWQTKFPGKITYLNNGIGATGSGFGTHRVGLQLLPFHPDFVVIDFAVNDVTYPNSCKQTMEGFVRQILKQSNSPAILEIFFMTNPYISVQDSFLPICDYYGLPRVSYKDRIKALVDSGKITLASIYEDGVHPNQTGHTYAANLLRRF